MCDIQSNMRYSPTNKFNSYCQKQENLTYVTTFLDSWKLYIKLPTIKNVTILRTEFGCFIFIFPCLKRLILVWQDLLFDIMVYNAKYCNVKSKIRIKIIRETQANLQNKMTVFFTIAIYGKCAKHCHMDTNRKGNT